MRAVRALEVLKFHNGDLGADGRTQCRSIVDGGARIWRSELGAGGSDEQRGGGQDQQKAGAAVANWDCEA